MEEKKVQFLRDQKRIARLKKGGPQKRQQAEAEEREMRKQETKNKKSLDEEQRSIHESYQILLNEYYIRKAYREKSLKTGEAKEDSMLKKTAQLLLSKTHTSTNEAEIVADDNI